MPKDTWIYLIRDNTTKTFKIGNALNPFERVKQLKHSGTKLPIALDLELLNAWYATEDEERYLHRKFKSKRINGEWFNLDGSDINAIYLYFALYIQLFSREPMQHIRTCAYCNHKGSYDSFPDGSTTYLGIFSCADCLQKEITNDFREVLAFQ